MFENLIGRTPQWINIRTHFAVAVPYLPQSGSILFEVRADTLKRQPGEISFPGGMVEKGETMAEAAVRETMEELLIQKEQIHMLAPLDKLIHGGTSIVHPFLVELQNYENTFSTDEVKEVFTVPFSFFMRQQPEVYHTEQTVVKVEEGFPYERLGIRQYPWAKSRQSVLFYPYKGYEIWGMTAKIMHNLVQLQKKMGKKK